LQPPFTFTPKILPQKTIIVKHKFIFFQKSFALCAKPPPHFAQKLLLSGFAVPHVPQNAFGAGAAGAGTRPVPQALQNLLFALFVVLQPPQVMPPTTGAGWGSLAVLP